MDDKNIVKNFRDDLILFKNETLKDLKNTEKSLLEKYKNTEYLINEKIEIFEKQFKNFNDKIINILAFIDGLKDVNSNINSLLKYKNKSENSIIDLELKLRSLDKESHDSLYSISSILKNSVIYPAVIGPTAKHKTFHDLVDFILLNISQLKQFKDRITKEVSENRIRQDNNFANLKGNFDTLTEKTKALVVNEIISIENKNNSFFKLYDEKFQDFRMDNAKNALIIKNTEQLVESFRQQFKEMDVTKNDFIKKNEEINQQLKQQNKEITTIKEKYQSLANYVKQIKFRNDNQNGNISGNLKTSINVNNNDTKNNQNEEDLEKNIDFNELSSSNKELMKIKLKKNESGLKAYIRGKISINQLQTLQNRNNFKSVESFKNNNNVQTEEDLKNKTNFFSEKTKRAVNINKEETKINSQRKESNKLRIQNLLNEDNNLYNNTIASQDLESYLKIDTLSSEQRKHHENIISNPRIIKTQNIRNISLKVEGNEILNINNPVDQKNKKYKSIIQDVKNIIESNNSNNNSRLNNNLSGFPKIVTNQGERIIISSHPVYHRHKFTKNVNQNILSLNRTIQRFYSNSKDNKYSLNNDKKTPNILFKENKYIDENFNNFIKKNTGNNISIKRNNNNKNDIKNTLFNNGNKNEEGHNLIDTKERNNSFQNSKDNRYFKLMTYSDKNKKAQ